MGECARNYSAREIDWYRFVNFRTPVSALSGGERTYRYEGASVRILQQEHSRFTVIVHTEGRDEEAGEILSKLENEAYASLIRDFDPSMSC